MKNGEIDGIVVDLPTAGLHHDRPGRRRARSSARSARPPAPSPSTSASSSSKDSPLTACVNQAIAALDGDGTLDALTNEWLPFSNAPELQP